MTLSSAAVKNHVNTRSIVCLGPTMGAAYLILKRQNQSADGKTIPDREQLSPSRDLGQVADRLNPILWE